MAVIGSGIMASRLSPDDVGLQLLENAAATAGRALVALIWMLGGVSGAHFNPVVTIIDRAFGGIRTREVGLYIAAQVIGGSLGAVLANLMFDLPAIDPSSKVRSSGALWLSEVVATTGPAAGHPRMRPQRTGQRRCRRRRRVDRWRLLLHLVDELRQPRRPPIARTLSDTFAGIAPSSAPMFIVMQLVGAAVAFGLIRVLFPVLRSSGRAAGIE